MSPLATFRRAPWLSGALALLLVAGMIAPLGLRLGSHYWAYYVGLAAFLLLSFGWIERLRKAASAPRPPRARGTLRVVQGGRGNRQVIDLAKEDTTDSQRWLM
jgi:hypothetical protein